MEKNAESFEFVSYNLEQAGKIELVYTVHFEDQTSLVFKERVQLPRPFDMELLESPLLDKTLEVLHFVCGLSYWKTYCPRTIRISTTDLTKEQAQFWNTVYTKGLGEFYFTNQIDYRGLVRFPFSEEKRAESFPLERQSRALMGIGGGKDSIVTYELFKKEGIPTTGFLLETQKEYPLITNLIQQLKVDTLKVKRVVDPQLFDSDLLKNAYNGHIPITAVYSAVALLCAVLYDYKFIVMSNEKSANYGNVQYLGEEINHQWSKSEEFEQLFQEYIHANITKDIRYLSLLRPWSELRIVEEFVKYPQYFSIFSSCNNNFKIYKEQLQGRNWCGHCPKCAFVFALLAAFLPKQKVVEIFGKNLFADEQLTSLYKQLLGIQDFKPFECVGTPEEVKTAFVKAQQAGEYSGDVLMQMFTKEVLPTIP